MKTIEIRTPFYFFPKVPQSFSVEAADKTFIFKQNIDGYTIKLEKDDKCLEQVSVEGGVLSTELLATDGVYCSLNGEEYLFKLLYKTDNIYLVVGPSGTGKSTVVEELTKRNLKDVWSYTTRPKRTPDEKYHTFISVDEFEKLENICAYTFFDGNHYGVTEDMLDDCSLYVIDPAGVEYLKKEYKGKKKFKTIYLCCDDNICKERMLMRGDSEEKVEKRLLNDKKMFADFPYDMRIDTTKSSIAAVSKMIFSFILISEKRG